MIFKDFDTTVNKFKKLLATDENFDIVFRPLTIADRKAALIFVDGFLKDTPLGKILAAFISIKDTAVLKDAKTFAESSVAYGEVELSDDEDKIIQSVLSGQTVLFVDGFNEAILIDARTYPQRDTSEPDKDKVFRGSRDGFVETLILNTALIRRRIRDTNLVMQYVSVGSESKTDVAICYKKDIVDKELLKSIQKRLKTVKVKSLTMNQESMAEILVKRNWYNPLPKFKFTERPDTAAAHVLEGDIIVLVDNSPSVIIIPATMFSIMEEANDYYFPPFIGTYLKLTRGAVLLFTVLLTPTWLLLTQNPDWVPEWLKFILITDDIKVPLIAQLLILEIAIDGMKLASLNTPNMLTTSLSVIAAIIVGDYAVQSGWFNPQALLYTAFVALANFSQPGYELGYAFKFIRIFVLITTFLLGVLGYFLGIALAILMFLTTKTVSGRCYLYPLIPFNWSKLKHHFYRSSLLNKK